MKVTGPLLQRLLSLERGESVPFSSLPGELVSLMTEDGAAIIVSHGRMRTLRAPDPSSFRTFVEARLGIRDLRSALDLLETGEASRAAQVDATGDSKFVRKRTFKGFLVNSYVPVKCLLGGRPLTILPPEGTYVFVYDWEEFRIGEDVTVVGIENSENFRQILRQKPLFDYTVSSDRILFVSRYPQTGDLQRWLQTIPNRYVHFGDLDPSGINIFLTEFRSRLGERSSFLVPEDYDKRVASGSARRYEDQLSVLRHLGPLDSALEPLVRSIRTHKRGYDQEGFIERPLP